MFSCPVCVSSVFTPFPFLLSSHHLLGSFHNWKRKRISKHSLAAAGLALTPPPPIRLSSHNSPDSRADNAVD
jgi:hypothetical protein